MIVLNLARGKSGVRVPLRLPASGADVKHAFDLQHANTKSGIARIDSVIGPVPNLGGYLAHLDITDPDEREKLNALAEKIDAMTQTEQAMFSCVLDARSINDAIGIEYHAGHSGALTPEGYVVRRSEVPQEEMGTEPVFRVKLWSEAMWNAGVEQPYPLELPAPPLKLEQARRAVGNGPFETVDIVQAECLVPKLRDYLTMDYPDVEVMQELGEKVREFLKASGQMEKFLAVLSVEQPDALVDALELADRLDTYSLFPDDAEAYGQEALKMNFPGVDDALIAALDTFMDWDAYGRYIMEADGIRVTAFGLLRRENEPFSDVEIGQQMM